MTPSRDGFVVESGTASTGGVGWRSGHAESRQTREDPKKNEATHVSRGLDGRIGPSGTCEGRKGLCSEVYGSFAIVVVIGLLLRTHRTVFMIGVAVLTSSVLFFVFTNVGVWATSGLYPRTMIGLVTCFTAALPFFCNMLAGDAIYATALFGGFALLEQWVPSLGEARPAPSPA
jgi:hypothetical protein